MTAPAATRSYRVTHETAYRYTGGEVSSSYGTFHLRPRDLPWQRVHQHQGSIEPAEEHRSVRTDGYGNRLTVFHVSRPHTALVITARSRITVSATQPPPTALALPWERARPDLADDPAAWRTQDFVLASPRVALVAESAEYVRPSFPPGRPIGEALLELTSRIHTDFAYVSGSTTVTTAVPEVFARRQGVCQDFAQVMISCLRSLGLAVRYVSGYLATTPPPGRPRLVGADASHAWVAVWIPATAGGPGLWWHLDPTNDRPCDQAHATVAWGRDYGDVAPVRGIIYSQSTGSSLSVSVDMAPVDEAAPPDDSGVRP